MLKEKCRLTISQSRSQTPCYDVCILYVIRLHHRGEKSANEGVLLCNTNTQSFHMRQKQAVRASAKNSSLVPLLSVGGEAQKLQNRIGDILLHQAPHPFLFCES